MKRQLTILTALLGMTMGWNAMADTWTDPDTDIEWTYTVSGGKAIIGTGNMYETAIARDFWDMDITVPSVINDYPVTGINAYAFYDCNGITGVTIPASVTSIGAGAFCECCELVSMTIPEGVTDIAGGCFFSCTSLTNVVMPSSLTAIGNQAFYNCVSLKSVDIPESVTNIGECTFFYCCSLTNVVMPSNLMAIGTDVFYGCESLKGVTIPSKVTNIGATAFAECISLTNVTIPASVTSIGSSAFSGCYGLNAIDVAQGSASYASIDGALFDISIKNLIQCPAGKAGAFKIPEGVTNIGEGAFFACSGLTNVTLPESVTSIGSSAFAACSSLTNVAIPASVTSIGNAAFSDCSGLKDISVDPENEYYASKNGYLLTKDETLLIRSANSTKAIPETVKDIGDSAFSGCSAVPNVAVPSGVTNIGVNAFFSCGGVTNVTIPNGMTTIRSGAFDSSGLQSVTIPASVTNIEGFAFADCKNLNAVFQGNAPEAGWAFTFGWGSPEGYTATVYNDTTGWGEEASWGGLVLMRIPRDGAVGAEGSVITIGGSAVSNDWLISNGVANVGDSAETVAAKMAQVGKNGILRYQSYVFGMVPESDILAEDQLKATIGFDENGAPIIGYTPTPNVPSLVNATTLGVMQLGDDWSTVWEGSESYYNFFKIQLEIQAW